MKAKALIILFKMKKFHVSFLHFFIFAFLLASCQKSDFEYDSTPQGNLDALWQLIDERYCFLTYKEKELGISWQEMHAKYSEKLNPKMSRVQLFESPRVWTWAGTGRGRRTIQRTSTLSFAKSILALTITSAAA